MTFAAPLARPSRRLDLRAAFRAARDSATPLDPPLFRAPALNKAIIVRQHLPDADRALFTDRRRCGVKILFPINLESLSAGARAVYVGQAHFLARLSEAAGLTEAEMAHDAARLEQLDALPNFDPFVFEGWLNLQGVAADPRIWNTARSAIAGHEANLLGDVRGTLSGALDGGPLAREAAEMAAAIFRVRKLDGLEPLRLWLDMSPAAFRQGLISWRSVLFYRWTAESLLSQLLASVSQLVELRPPSRLDPALFAASNEGLKAVVASVHGAFARVRNDLQQIDDAARRARGAAAQTVLESLLRTSAAILPGLGADVTAALQFFEVSADLKAASAEQTLRPEKYFEMIRNLRTALGALPEAPPPVLPRQGPPPPTSEMYLVD